ncbi:lipopolysaccharide-induced tumor necrosis factor-alpha factor homolog isoform X1 [Bolinopsis microptera]|uniref:lipopolysaccharide-induced tumor necrosis factor-alpha factor homolog isoform X1 n=1 Tax=Bolinopsis microptera TaxID=2820187 RepID=UPI003079AFAA
MAAPPPPYAEKGGPPPPPGDYPPQGQPAYPPPQQAYPPQYPPQQAPGVVVVQNIHYDRYPVQVNCPNCRQLVQSRVDYETGTGTWLIGCFICICAFCIDACKDAVHVCPSCAHILGRKNLI